MATSATRVYEWWRALYQPNVLWGPWHTVGGPARRRVRALTNGLTATSAAKVCQLCLDTGKVPNPNGPPWTVPCSCKEVRICEGRPA
jgi:hypothetical protein